MQPITFRWHAVAGAEKYWFCLSPDDWSTLTVNDLSITDTFIVVSGLLYDHDYIWNVAAGNDGGWSSWSTGWTFITASAPVYDQTIIVDWNKRLTPSAMTDDAAIVFTNIQQRDVVLVLTNPSGKVVLWPDMTWPGLATPPQPAVGDTSMYLFVQALGHVYGVDFTKIGSGSGVSASWVLSQLGAQIQFSALTIAPANASDTGTFGEIRIAGGYIYACTATNTWIRCALSTW